MTRYSSRPSAGARVGPWWFTPTQLEVSKALVEEPWTDKEGIARSISLSVSSIKKTLSELYLKTGVGGSGEKKAEKRLLELLYAHRQDLVAVFGSLQIRIPRPHVSGDWGLKGLTVPEYEDAFEVYGYLFPDLVVLMKNLETDRRLVHTAWDKGYDSLGSYQFVLHRVALRDSYDGAQEWPMKSPLNSALFRQLVNLLRRVTPFDKDDQALMIDSVYGRLASEDASELASIWSDNWEAWLSTCRCENEEDGLCRVHLLIRCCDILLDIIDYEWLHVNRVLNKIHGPYLNLDNLASAAPPSGAKTKEKSGEYSDAIVGVFPTIRHIPSNGRTASNSHPHS